MFKFLRSDRAKEFLVTWFEEWLQSIGAVHEMSLIYTAQQNSTVERYNGVLQGVARSIPIESYLSPFSPMPSSVHVIFETVCLIRGKRLLMSCSMG